MAYSFIQSRTASRKIAWGPIALAIVAGAILFVAPSVAQAAHGVIVTPRPQKPVTPTGPTTKPPVSTGNNGGSIPIVGVKIQTGFDPQSKTPIGTPNAPLSPQSEWDKFKDKMLLALAAIDTPAGDKSAQTQAVRAAIHSRDVQIAKLPKHITVATATQN